LLGAALLVSGAASADVAVTTQGLNMRAGPDVSYPQVAFLGRGVAVDVVGCVEGWRWCDVIAGPNRGWVSAQYLSYNYYNRPTVISYGGPTLGIPLIAFSIAPYWDNYYRARPWYSNRHYWYDHRVARAPAWQEPPHYSQGHGNNYNSNPRANYRGDGGRGNDNRGNTSSDRPQYGGHYSANTGPDPRPHINDQAHPNAQQ
jgi:uncharacterized protein YraI